MPDRPTVNADRLWSTLLRSAEIGPGVAGGLRRLTLSDADRQMRDLFVTWCREAGCTVTVDRLGSLFARRAGTEPDLPPVLIGSHLDTQYAGGRYDGILGVLAGLEVVRRLNELGLQTRRSIEIVNWTNEEGGRFTPPMLASTVFAGVQSVDWALARTDDTGTTVAAELERIGYAGDGAVGGRSIDAYFEFHIEQGPILHAEGIPVGIVTGGYATRGFNLAIEGETAHSGPTPMDRRRNALVAAGMVAVAVNEIGWAYADSDGKSTAARLELWPNKAGILSSHGSMTVDFRHPDPAKTAEMEERFHAALADCAERSRCAIRVAEDWTWGAERFDPDLNALCRSAADDLGVAHRDILSQAGHDAYMMTRVCPTALIFCPCKDGITHNEAEHVEPEWAIPGANVLLNAVLARAGG